jgi:hypothetical protein
LYGDSRNRARRAEKFKADIDVFDLFNDDELDLSDDKHHQMHLSDDYEHDLSCHDKHDQVHLSDDLDDTPCMLDHHYG